MPELGKLWIIVGTRPECIKQAPVYAACRDALGAEAVSLIGTGQHRGLLQTALDDFGLRLDVNFDIMKQVQSLPQIMTAVISKFEALAETTKPECVIVQGDTTTACAAAMAAFQMGIRVAHNEAGLRSYDMQSPFPEEANRRLIATVADIHFAPTESAKTALLKEGIAPERVHVVGNPGIDSLFLTLRRGPSAESADIVERLRSQGQDIALLTAHRREAKGEGMDNMFAAIGNFLAKNETVSLIYPVHPNDLGAAAARKHLARFPRRALIVQPMAYRSVCHIVSQSRLVVTDSGGIQEEAATLGIPTVVCRTVTERREAVDVGIARVAGLKTTQIIDALDWAYETGRNRSGSWSERPFGDGNAGTRIAEIIASVVR